VAFTFPQGLAPELYPLAWLVGSWRGEGVLEYPGLQTSGFIQEVTFSHDGGPYLRYESTIRLTPHSMPEVPDPLAEFEKLDRQQAGSDAESLISDDSLTSQGTTPSSEVAGSGGVPEAAAQSEVPEPDDDTLFWSTESGYWRIAPEPHQGVPKDYASLEVLLSDPAGRVTVYLGMAGEGKVQLVSDLIARTGTAAEVTASKRVYGNVSGDLMWVQSLAAFGNPLQDYVSATLTRVEQ